MQKVKYPRTYHLPYSPSVTDDDKTLQDDSQFWNKVVSCSIKMDGENTTVYPNGEYHARSVDGYGKKWQSWLKQYIETWCHDIPENWRVCGENLYAKHSIGYTFPDKTYLFQVFGIYNEKNECLSIDDELEWCKMLGVRHVPVFYRGYYSKDAILTAFDAYKMYSKNDVEGFVVRVEESFPYFEFSRSTGKYVRAHHVQTDEHWTKFWTPNKVSWNENN